MKGINIEENIENRIIDLITKGSEDRLIAFKPRENTGSVDLVVKKRGEYKPQEIIKKTKTSFKVGGVFSAPPKTKSEELSFQINVFVGPGKTDIISKDISQDNFISNKGFYSMFIYFDEVKQDVGNIWIVPSFMFLEIAEPQKLENNKTILRFETTVNPEKQDKYSRFLIDKKELGNFLLQIIETKGNIDFSRNSFTEDKSINLNKLQKFITEARENTYASDSGLVTNPRLHGSIQLEFEKADHFYRDIFFTGSKMFIGQEIVYHNNRPIWAMNYFGDEIDKTISVFLKESLLKLSQECRFGKSCEFEKRGFKYQDEGRGSLEYFSGKEQIFQKNKDIYNLTYQGGLL
ncbi:MAG: hypothetical protein HY219_01390 [Candidatus Staskawiczbacteria bacterium]|nr:hypothetical protein [Candidatus Staskawiczbacteria bacterium]